VAIYSDLSTAQRYESRFDAPKLFLQVLFTMDLFSDLAVLAVCLRFLTELFKDYAELFAFSVDLILLRLLVFSLRLFIVLIALISSHYACLNYLFLHFSESFLLILFQYSHSWMTSDQLFGVELVSVSAISYVEYLSAL
jgi:hypothetical protein